MITPLTAVESAQFIASARSMLGMPFRHRGRSLRGVDCIGLVVLALQSVGRAITDRDDYSRNPANDGLRAALVAHFGPPVDDLRAGDVLLLCWGKDEENHVGIVFAHPCGGFAIVHALAQARRVIEHGFDADDPRIAGVFRP